MANITISVPDAMVSRIQDAFVSADFLIRPGEPTFVESGLTPLQWIQKKLRDHIKYVLATQEAAIASEAAKVKANTDIG